MTGGCFSTGAGGLSSRRSTASRQRSPLLSCSRGLGLRTPSGGIPPPLAPPHSPKPDHGALGQRTLPPVETRGKVPREPATAGGPPVPGLLAGSQPCRVGLEPHEDERIVELCSSRHIGTAAGVSTRGSANARTAGAHPLVRPDGPPLRRTD